VTPEQPLLHLYDCLLDVGPPRYTICGFRKETIAGLGRNGRDAPITVIGLMTSHGHQEQSTQTPSNKMSRSGASSTGLL
jgi:hypothetical protein